MINFVGLAVGLQIYLKDCHIISDSSAVERPAVNRNTFWNRRFESYSESLKLIKIIWVDSIAANAADCKSATQETPEVRFLSCPLKKIRAYAGIGRRIALRMQWYYTVSVRIWLCPFMIKKNILLYKKWNNIFIICKI